MSLLISKYPLVFNLPAIWRDFGLSAAELKNLVEGEWLSIDGQNEASRRRESVYFDGDTKCDGYLLSYSFDSVSEYVEFEQHVLSLGFDFERTVHIMYSYCLWVKKVSISCIQNDVELELQALRHVDDPRNELHLNRRIRLDIASAEGFTIETSLLRLSLEYIDYQDRGLMRFLIDSALSLCKTGFTHIHYYRPRLHDVTISHEQSLTICSQLLPGLLSIVPESELYHAVKFESKMPYLNK